MKAIVNATLVLPDHLIPDGILLIEEGRIAAFGEKRKLDLPAGCEILDAGGLYVGPGFVDIHAHAGGGYRFAQEPAAAARAHLAQGTTSVLATPATASSVAEYLEGIGRIRRAMETPEGANIAGIYMEGPYINPRYGSSRHDNPWSDRGVLPEDYAPLLEAGKDLIRVWVLAPELEGIGEFVKAAKGANPEVRFAVGHSEATPEQIEKLIPMGLCIGTHHTNATGTLPHGNGVRSVSVDEAVNYNNAIYAELISDSMGIHVDPFMQRLIRRLKGPDKLILISDQTAHPSTNPPGFEEVTDLNFTPMPDGGVDISGSRLTLSAACRNMMIHTGASIVDVFRYASRNPARAVGLTDRGELRVGLRADLVICDHRMNIQSVILKGEIQK